MANDAGRGGVEVGQVRKHVRGVRRQRGARGVGCRRRLGERGAHALDVLLARAKVGLEIRAHRRQLRVASGRKLGELRTQRVALRLEIGHDTGLRRVNLGHLRKHAIELRLQRVALGLQSRLRLVELETHALDVRE